MACVVTHAHAGHASTAAASDTGEASGVDDENDDRDHTMHHYALVAATHLPVLDLSRSVRSVLLGARVAAMMSTLVRKFSRTIVLLFLGSVVTGMLACLLPVASGRSLAVATLIGLPASLAVIASLRYDIVRLLLTTYECWFFTLTAVFSSVLLGVYMFDKRALIIPTILVGTLSNIFVDANSRVDRSFVVASVAAATYTCLLLAYAALHMIDATQDIVLFRTGARSLSVEDALVNGWGTLLVLTCRNVYRRRAVLKKHDASSAVVHCISYRCRLKLVRVVERPPQNTLVSFASPRQQKLLAHQQLSDQDKRRNVALRAPERSRVDASRVASAPASLSKSVSTVASISKPTLPSLSEVPTPSSPPISKHSRTQVMPSNDIAGARLTTTAPVTIGEDSAGGQATRTTMAMDRAASAGDSTTAEPRAALVTSPKRTPMHFEHGETTFAADDTLGGKFTELLLACDANVPLLRGCRMLLHASGVSGFLLVLVSIAFDSAVNDRRLPSNPVVGSTTGSVSTSDPASNARVNANATTAPALLWLQVAALACTTVFCVTSAYMYQRQLVRRLVFSFDFAFLSFQLTAVHVCVCDLVRWDGLSLVVCANWLWMHWVLAVDALTPFVQRHLGFRSRAFALPVVALFVVCQIAVAAAIVFDPHSSLQDRVVCEYVLSAEHRLQVRVVPFLLSRVMTLLSWSLRILWRLWTLKERESELVVIQGGVSYVCPRRHKTLTNLQLRRAAVVPVGGAGTSSPG